MKRVLVLLPLALAACSDDEKAAPPSQPGGGGPGPAANKPAEPPKEDPAARQAKLDALKEQKTALAARVAELEQALKDLEAQQKDERAQLPKGPELVKLRNTVRQMQTDFASERAELESMEERFKELKRFAESEITGNLKTLLEKLDDLEKKRAEITDAWRADLAASRQGRVEESPVRQELSALRDVKTKWFEETPAARSGRAGADEKKAINDSFRSFLGSTPAYKAVVGKVLEQPQAPKGKSPDSYDFTELEFFLLLELMEDTLDRLNIAAEKKVLTENKAKLDTLEKELASLEEKIAQEMMKGGDDLEAFEDLNQRLKPQRDKVDYLAEQYKIYKDLLDRAMAIGDRHIEQYDEAAQAIEAAKKDLKATEAELRKMGA